jgi:membrane protein required for colicin V production
LLLAAAVVIDMTAMKNSVWWQESQGAPILSAALKGLKPVLPEQFAKYLN